MSRESQGAKGLLRRSLVQALKHSNILNVLEVGKVVSMKILAQGWMFTLLFSSLLLLS